MTELTKILTSRFGGLTIDVVCSGENQEPGVTRKQLGEMLGYGDPVRAIGKIHRKNRDRFDSLEGLIKTTHPSDGGNQEMWIYGFKAVLEVCRFSEQPKANAVIDWAWETLDRLRRGEIQAVDRTEVRKLREENALLYDENATLRHSISFFRSAEGSIPIQQAVIKFIRNNIWKGTEYQLIDLLMAAGILQRHKKRRFLVVYKKYFDRGYFDWPILTNGQPQPMCKSDIMLTIAGYHWLAGMLTKFKEARDNPLLDYASRRDQQQIAFRSQHLPH